MASASVSHELLLPRPPGGMVPGAAMALLAHAAMFVALTSMVQWRASPVEAVSAELWSALPQQAAPPAPEPAAPVVAPPPAPPPPAPAPPPARVDPPAPDPQIAIAQARLEREKSAREKAERERAEKDRLRREREAQERQREAEALKRREAETRKREQQERAEAQRLAEQRQKNLERMMGQAGTGAVSSTGTAVQSSGPSASYTGRLIAAIKPNIVFTEVLNGNPATEVEVRAGPSGTILSHRIVRPSGSKDWDDAVSRAIDRTGTLPRDIDGRVPPVLTIVFRPKE